MKRALLALALAVWTPPAFAASWTDTGAPTVPSGDERVSFKLGGYLRSRGELLDDLDLDRGPTPSGQPFFPVPAGGGQVLTAADMRLRLRPEVLVDPGVALHAEVDVFDDLAFGSTPLGVPFSPEVGQVGASPGQGVPQAGVNALRDAVRVKRLWADARTPFGLLSIGRMPSAWGLGMAYNDGECLDCDETDSADRIAFILPASGLLWGVGYDAAASGPQVDRGDRSIDLDPTDDVRGLSLAIVRYDNPAAVQRKLRAELPVLDGGLLLTHRFQDFDHPFFDALGAAATSPGPAVRRGYSAWSADAWLRLLRGGLRVEAEAIAFMAQTENVSDAAGVVVNQPLTAHQLGAALESDYRFTAHLGAGLDTGYASGDRAPGFGATAVAGPPTRPGDLDGPQYALPGDSTYDNFRFHPDYRVDRIFFRNILGRLTDAVYVRPHTKWALGAGLEASLFAVGSMAVDPESTPSGRRPLGIELDPGLAYRAEDGFTAHLEYAAFLPLSGLDNPAASLTARPAQILRLWVAYVF